MYKQTDAIIGIDAEWRIPLCNNGEERQEILLLLHLLTLLDSLCYS